MRWHSRCWLASGFYFVVGVVCGAICTYVGLERFAASRETAETTNGAQVSPERGAASRQTARLLCWVMTSPENLATKATAVKQTWGRRCDVLLFASDEYDRTFPTINVTVPHGRTHLVAKTMQTFDYVYRNHVTDADWFLKADDDTYVVIDNLRHLVANWRTTDAVHFGHHFRGTTGRSRGFQSGGAGYVLSRAALKLFGTRAAGACATDGRHEDFWLSACLEKLGVSTADTRDALGRSRFHAFSPGVHLTASCPSWYHRLSKYPILAKDSVSESAISFHYMTPQDIYALDFAIYRLRTGNSVLENNNGQRSVDDDVIPEGDLSPARASP